MSDYLKKNRKWLLLLADQFIILICSLSIFAIACYTGYIFSLDLLLFGILILCICISAFQILFKTYDSLWRYAESKEYILLLFGMVCGLISFELINFSLLTKTIPLIFMLSAAACSFIMMLLMRFTYRIYRQYNKVYHLKNSEKLKRVAIIGAGEAGNRLLCDIQSNPFGIYKVCYFIDDDIKKIGHNVQGVPVYGPSDKLTELLLLTPVDEIFLAIPTLNFEKRRKVIEKCHKANIKIKILPDTVLLLKHGDLSCSLREIRIEDLLGRTAVEIKHNDLPAFISGQVVLVTGGGGSIGAELCRQIVEYSPKKLIIFDAFENDAYIVKQELFHLFQNTVDVVVEIGSVRDRKRLDNLFADYCPSLVFHAAAHKHVPLMEQNVDEAIKNNIFGTYNLLMVACKYKADKFVMISTDKAVNPTNVMGATKRFCELMVQSMNDIKDCTTSCVSVRFGNVLGSNGSVIPLFKMQIEHGGPVTITDKRITRYFMTITEAASLVLKAGAMAENSETFVLDMGEPVKIIELAENLITLSGYEPYREMPIVEIGLRPGEKLYEELLIDKNQHCKTADDKIYIEKAVQLIHFEEIDSFLQEFKQAVECNDKQKMIEILRRAVPTFRTPNETNNCNKAYTIKETINCEAVITNINKTEKSANSTESLKLTSQNLMN